MCAIESVVKAPTFQSPSLPPEADLQGLEWTVCNTGSTSAVFKHKRAKQCSYCVCDVAMVPPTPDVKVLHFSADCKHRSQTTVVYCRRRVQLIALVTPEP